MEDYSSGAHLSAVLAAIQYSETLLQSQDDEGPDYEGKDKEDDYSCLQNPTNAGGVRPRCACPCSNASASRAAFR